MKFSAGMMWRSRTFWAVIAVFIVANGWSWLRHRVDPACCDREMTIGFPFPFHVSGGLAGLSEFYVFGLLLDLVVAWTVAILAVWIVRGIAGGSRG